MPVRTEHNLKPVPTRLLFKHRYGYELIFYKPLGFRFHLYQYNISKDKRDMFLGDWFAFGLGFYKKRAKRKKDADRLLFCFIWGWQPMQQKEKINKFITIKTYRKK